jgi:hypothetical protein
VLRTTSDCGITAAGIDFIEGRSADALVKEMIDARSGSGTKHRAQLNRIEAHRNEETPTAVEGRVHFAN